ncbi:MAG TPA: hypothetical protein VKN36_08600, partial [Eudoraea sp.]|nr:hypothetical protein [Eudoraea sp.]
MDVIHHILPRKKIKFTLIFFCLILSATACKEEQGIRDLMVTYEEGSPVAVQLSTGLDPETLSIHVTGNTETRVLGSMGPGASGYVFRPLIPFTAGQSYEIRYKEKLLSTFKVAAGQAGSSPELLAVYPSKDTVPENLLKVYLQFSQPMQE